MRKILASVTFLFFVLPLNAQTLEEAVRRIYYERYESAKTILSQLIHKPDASPDTWYWLGEIYLLQQKTDSASKVFRAGIDYCQSKKIEQRESPLVFIGFAHLLLDENQAAEAKMQMDAILEIGKNKDPLTLWAVARANILSKNGDLAYARSLLEKAQGKDKKNVQLYLAKGDMYRKSIDASQAVVNYRKALDIDPNLAEAMYKLGRIYKSQKNTEIYFDRFNKAFMLDSAYAPVLNELYYYYLYRDVVKAQEMLARLVRHSDYDPHHAYMQADLFYISKKYKDAINMATSIVKAEGEKTLPRIYKMLAYSRAALGDSAEALVQVNQYFKFQSPEAFMAKDYELKARLLEKLGTDKMEAINWYKKALALESDQQSKLNYMITLAELQKENGNAEREALWRGKIFETKIKPNNVDIFKWGVALYKAENYLKADSVFAIYSSKFPDQVYGYLWRARCNAQLDSSMENGLAVPYYEKLIEVASVDSIKNKDNLVRAYGYLAAYEANIAKDYQSALLYFDHLLALNPENQEAIKSAEVIRGWIESEKPSH